MTQLTFRILSLLKYRIQDVWQKVGPWGHGLVYLMLLLPFSLMRHVRIHGDEKVYVGQALEMIRSGHFWQQLQFGEINYIKGPLHYLLLIAGHHAFGFSMLSTVYMNLLLAALAVTALRFAADFLMPSAELKKYRAIPAWLFASSGAFVMFSLSSQMDSELTSLYAIVLSLAVIAVHTRNSKYLFILWLCTGLAGTLKSPLHSCLLGVSVLSYFLLSGMLRQLLLASPRGILALACGILICGIGYLVPYFADNEKWLGTYIFREQIDRPRFADPAFDFVLNNFFMHLLPWSLLFVHACAIAIKRIKTKTYQMDPLTRVGIAFLLPTFLFFFGFGYRASWYGLPMIPSLVMLVMSQLLTREDLFKDIAHAVLPWTAILMALVLLCHVLFQEGTNWWSLSAGITLSIIFVISFLILEAVASGRKIHAQVGLFTGIAIFWCGTLGLTATLGEAELGDLRVLIAKDNAPLNYSNIEKENYSEWGYMSYMSGRPSYYSNSFDELHAAGKNGQWLIFTQREELYKFWSWMDNQNIDGREKSNIEVNLWRRWPRNMEQLRDLWKERTSTENTWDKTTRHFYVVRYRNSPSQMTSIP